MAYTTHPFDEIPLFRPTSEILEFIGFTAEVAAERHASCTGVKPDCDEEDLLDFGCGEVTGVVFKHPQLSARAQMRMMGILPYIQEAILKPEYEEVFRTQTLSYWIKETLKCNWYTLELLNKQRDSHGAVDEGRDVQPGITPVATINVDPTGPAFPPRWFKKTSGRPPLLPGHTRLWQFKCGGDVLMPRCVQDDEEMLEWMFRDGVVWNDRDTYVGDFDWMRPASYFLAEEEVAEKRRRYAAVRCPWASTCLISVDVPDDFLASLRTERLWCAMEDWKGYVYMCRGRKTYNREEHRKYSDEAELIIGHICAKDSETVFDVDKEEVQARITDDWALELENGEKATQYAFAGETMLEMVKRIRGRVHVEVTASLQERRVRQYEE